MSEKGTDPVTRAVIQFSESMRRYTSIMKLHEVQTYFLQEASFSHLQSYQYSMILPTLDNYFLRLKNMLGDNYLEEIVLDEEKLKKTKDMSLKLYVQLSESIYQFLSEYIEDIEEEIHQEEDRGIDEVCEAKVLKMVKDEKGE